MESPKKEGTTPTEESIISRAVTPPIPAEERNLWLQTQEREDFPAPLLLEHERHGDAIRIATEALSVERSSAVEELPLIDLQPQRSRGASN
ncbi:MAG: hypothetical protein ASARMPREDX12_000378 [Alectoria sarmentosa]|nr:MAG: hypothetical protein ASARMPREDX12_000378 [Alectoria sarmentosa]